MKKILTLLFTSFTFILFSQSITFKGVIKDETKAPVENAVVTIEGTDLSQRTNKEGYFIFDENIPLGKSTVTVTGLGYKTKFFTINVMENRDIFLEKIKLKFTKDEQRRRWVQKKVREEEERRIARERKKAISKLNKSAKPDKIDKDKSNENEAVAEQPIEKGKVYDEDISQIQIQYAKLLKVSVDDIFNEELYEFINKWKNTPYLIDGNTINGINNVFFVKKLLKEVFDLEIENNVSDIYNSKYTEKFEDSKFLNEGDLIFFKGSKSKSNQVTHIGVYLANNKFVHAIDLKNKGDKNKGVRISDLNNPFWKIRLKSYGRRIFH